MQGTFLAKQSPCEAGSPPTAVLVLHSPPSAVLVALPVMLLPPRLRLLQHKPWDLRHLLWDFCAGLGSLESC